MHTLTNRETIRVWSAQQPIPDVLMTAAAALVLPEALRHGEGVATYSIGDAACLLTDGYVPEHADWPGASLLLVIRNDTNSWVTSAGCAAVKQQPPGTFILLDIGYPHALRQVGGKKAQPGVWLAAVLYDFDEWPTHQHVQHKIDEFFAKYSETKALRKDNDG